MPESTLAIDASPPVPRSASSGPLCAWMCGCCGGSGMNHGIHCSRGTDRGQPVQPEPLPRLLDDGRPAPAAPRSAPVGVRGPAGLVGPEQQRSLLLRALGEGGVGCCDPSPHRGSVLLIGPELRALRGEAEASQDPAHRREGQFDLELAEDPWPDNFQRPVGELELELIGGFAPQSCEDHLPWVVGESGRASRLGLLSESLESILILPKVIASNPLIESIACGAFLGN